MVIYGEYLFLENLITGCLILSLTGKLGGLPVKKGRILAGGVLCGFYSFVLFLPGLCGAMALFSKLLFSGLVVRVGFGRTEMKRFAKTVFLFYAVSFALGGITIGMMYLLGIQGISANTALYIEGFTYVQVTVGCIAAYGGLSLLAGFLRERLLFQRTAVQVEIQLGEKKLCIPGMVDTGNFLTDPVTGRPVFLMEQQELVHLVSDEAAVALKTSGGAENIFRILARQEEGLGGRLCMIPYHSAGMSNGLLVGIRPDQVIVCTAQGTKPAPGVVIGLYEGIFPVGFTGEHYKILLNPMVIEGGVVCHE